MMNWGGACLGVNRQNVKYIPMVHFFVWTATRKTAASTFLHS